MSLFAFLRSFNDAKSAYRVTCPNCGHPAERHYFEEQEQIRTECPSCDYVMAICSQTCRVIEAYAPGIPIA